jgi:hypothetical protein
MRLSRLKLLGYGVSGKVKYYLTLIYQMVNLYPTAKAFPISLGLLVGDHHEKIGER